MIAFFRTLSTRYRPRYVRSLVYMMQASEYYTRDYLCWYHRTSDFSHVEVRKQLQMTTKAKLLLAMGYGVSACFVLVALWGATMPNVTWRGIALILVLGFPFLLPYALAVVLALSHIIQVPFERRAIARAKQKLATHKATRIAIAGSYGKTTMREILKTILSSQKKTAAPGKSINTPLGIAEFIQQLDGSEEVLIFEFGEYYPGDVRTLAHLVEPQMGVITGVNEAHLQRFKSLDATKDTIFELADHLGDRPVYVNGESVHARERADVVRSDTCVMYDRAGAGSWRIASARTDVSGLTIEFIRNGETIPVHTALLGLQNAGPIAAAADIASRLGIADAHIIEGIAAIKPFEHRMQPRTEASVTIIDDSYNGNPDGVAAAIAFLKDVHARRFYVTPGLVEMGSSTQEVHRTIGRLLADARIEHVVLMRNSVTAYIAEGLRQNNFHGELTWFDDMPAAIRALPHLTISGDVGLIQNDWPDQYA